MSDQFPEFWFESKQRFGPINSLSDLQDMIRTGPYDEERVLGAQESIYDRSKTVPSFGFRSEHKGERTLGQFLQERGINVGAQE